MKCLSFFYLGKKNLGSSYILLLPKSNFFLIFSISIKYLRYIDFFSHIELYLDMLNLFQSIEKSTYYILTLETICNNSKNFNLRFENSKQTLLGNWKDSGVTLREEKYHSFSLLTLVWCIIIIMSSQLYKLQIVFL